jgi:hypothetical protein
MTRRVAVGVGYALLALLALGRSAGPAAAADATPAGVEFFEKKVRPVLAEHCFPCHSAGAKKRRGGLALDSRAGMLKGGDSGPVLVPGQPDKSRLVEAVGYRNVDLQMPPRARLPDAAVADLAAWVKMGAPWPAEGAPTRPVAGKESFDLRQRKREHWAWQPVRPHVPPAVKDPAWARTPVDRFILASLEDKGLTPAPAADRRTLIRRVSFDLIGLPPAPEEVEAFVQDTSATAWEKVVDRLLASPRFGERWGRHWLDLVRYAETRGHEFDYPIPNAYQYRDYVVRALNEDLPYDRFVTEHLAGDLLPRPRLHPAEGFNESVLGTGFWFLGEELHSPVDVRQDEADRFDNQVDVLTKTFLGLTVACARCHDHKFDALSTRDYYALFGFLRSSNYRLAPFDSMEGNCRVAADLWELRRRGRAPVQRALAEAVRPGAERLADYLLAARAAMLAGPGADSKAAGGAFSPTYRRRLEEVARARKLDADTLGQWVRCLLEAARNADDPLHPWAKAACDAGAEDPRRLAALIAPVAEGWRQRDAEAAAALKGAEVIVDYARWGSASWLPDGVAFGPGPVRPGDVCWGGDVARPIVRFFDRAAAEKGPAWDVLRPAPGAENDPGALGSLVRAGRMIRTPEFTLTGGKVFYLVRGTGQAYAAVASHRMIAGPLHARLVTPVRAGKQFEWVAHDLSAYKGQHAHVEFTAAGDGDFAVAMVVQAQAVPGPVGRPNRALLRLLGGAGSLEGLAAGYQRLFLDLAGRLAADRLVGSEDAPEQARLANWVLRRPGLFARGDTLAKRLTEAAGPVIAEQARLLARVKAQSRLALALMDGSAQDEHVFIRGSPKTPGAVVPRRFLEALAGSGRLPVTRGSGRLELARQMTDPALDPFLPRVMVNRVWHHLFGRGIVASVDNFGVLGERPTHPELLDHLAGRFVEEGWSVKKLIRSLVLSSAYRMSSTSGGAGDRADPHNLLLHRMPLRRLEGEAIRDALLAVSGRLAERMYGPPVPVYLTAFQDGRGRPAGGPPDGDGRRSVYLAVRRNFLPPLLLAFDTPSPFSTVGRRTVSNVPAQALILLNDEFVHQQAGVWARRVLAQPESPRGRVTRMYRQAFARPPTDSELAACLDFLVRQAALSGHKPDDPAAWADLAHVLFNAKEFIFVH